MNSLLLTERDNMQYDRTLDGRNSAKSVVLKEKKEINITANFKNGPPQVQTRGGGVGGGGGKGSPYTLCLTSNEYLPLSY